MTTPTEFTDTYREDSRLKQTLSQIRNESKLFEPGLEVKINDTVTAFRSQDTDPDNPDHKTTDRVIQLANGGKLTFSSISNSRPKYHPPDGDREIVETFDVDIRGSELFAPGQETGFENLVGELVICNGNGLGEANDPVMKDYGPGRFRVREVVAVRNGKIVFDTSKPDRETRLSIRPAITTLDQTTFVQPIPDEIASELRCGRMYLVTSGGIVDRVPEDLDDVQWVIDADTWDASDPFIKTTHSDIRDYRVNGVAVREQSENAIGEFASLIRDERENLIGTTLVLNDEADPVEIVDFELKTRGGYQPSTYEVTVSDGRRLCAYTAEDSVRGFFEDAFSFDVWYVRVDDTDNVEVPSSLHGAMAGNPGDTAQATF